ncbi:MAG: hypothetical protein ABL912_01630 [Novosphingobium sp.]
MITLYLWTCGICTGFAIACVGYGDIWQAASSTGFAALAFFASLYEVAKLEVDE